MSPIRVDFYLLSDSHNQPDSLGLVACRLLEKAYFKGHRIFVHCSNEQDAHQIDELLWTFKEDSFIPHNMQGEGPEPPPPVHIGFEKEPRGFNDILLNLGAEVPIFYTKFKRIIEIVLPDEEQKALSRRRYQHYRSHGCTMHTHNI